MKSQLALAILLRFYFPQDGVSPPIPVEVLHYLIQHFINHLIASNGKLQRAGRSP